MSNEVINKILVLGPDEDVQRWADTFDITWFDSGDCAHINHDSISMVKEHYGRAELEFEAAWTGPDDKFLLALLHDYPALSFIVIADGACDEFWEMHILEKGEIVWSKEIQG